MCVGWRFFVCLCLRSSRCKVQILTSSLIRAWQRGFKLLACLIALLDETSLLLAFPGEAGRATLGAAVLTGTERGSFGTKNSWDGGPWRWHFKSY